MFEVPSTFITLQNRMRAIAAARRISAKPSTINIRRAGSFLGNQRVRIEGISGTSSYGDLGTNANADTYQRMMVVFGVLDHPTLTDFDVQVNDEFGYNGDMYMVTGVTDHSGERQAIATRLQS